MNKTRALFPFAMTIVGGLCIGSLTVVRMAQEPEFLGSFLCLAAIVMYGGWKAWEVRISMAEIHEVETDRDKGTVEICAAVEVALLLSLFLRRNGLPIGLAMGGLMIMAGGIHIRVIAVRTLGNDYSLRIRPLRRRPVCIGPYAIVRHPAYLGTLICHTGMVMVFANGYSFLILAVWYAMVLARTLVEDSVLMGSTAYQKYAQGVRWRLVPGIL